jgi:hypothetical protein
MGWSSGGALFGMCASAITKNVPDNKARQKIFKTMVEAFELFDCDVLYEAEGADPILDKVLKQKGHIGGEE